MRLRSRVCKYTFSILKGFFSFYGTSLAHGRQTFRSRLKCALSLSSSESRNGGRMKRPRAYSPSEDGSCYETAVDGNFESEAENQDNYHWQPQEIQPEHKIDRLRASTPVHFTYRNTSSWGLRSWLIEVTRFDLCRGPLCYSMVLLRPRDASSECVGGFLQSACASISNIHFHVQTHSTWIFERKDIYIYIKKVRTAILLYNDETHGTQSGSGGILLWADHRGISSIFSEIAWVIANISGGGISLKL